VTTELHPFDHEIIASIQNEARFFDMSQWVTGRHAIAATCDTASCIAGHIESLRPEMAKQLIEEDFEQHSTAAAEIYFHATGRLCRLDFLAFNHSAGDLKDITREEAVQHIMGIHPTWPQLDKDSL
jgi:hypothetical protein